VNWASFGDFLHMGGYGVYVWGAYGVTLAALAIEALALVMNERSTLSRLRRELERSGAR
jgi:heme exporter protein D